MNDTLRNFIRQNRAEIDEAALAMVSTFDPTIKTIQALRLTDVQRASWVSNDEVLRTWAESEGVTV